MKTGILFIIDSLAPGGTEKQLLALLRNLDRERFRPYLCVLRRSDHYLGNNHVPHLLLEFRAFYHPSTVGYLTALSSFIRANHIRLVQTFFQDPTLFAALSRPFHKARLIGSFRDLGFWRNCKETLKMRIAYHAYSGFIANSKAVKDHFVQFDKISPHRIGMIYNGISTIRKRPKYRRNSKNESPIIGIVANLNRPVKRVQDFIQAAAAINRLWPKARFFVVGDGHLRPSLETLSKNLALSESLTFTGLIQNPLDLIAGFDIGVNTSETEGFCNAILEYMACGIPVVATAAGGNPELVEDGDNGFLVPVGDFKKIAEKIDLLLRNDDLRARMQEANRQKVDSEFTLAKMVSGYESYYEKILMI